MIEPRRTSGISIAHVFALAASVLMLCACGGPKSYVVLLDSPDSGRPSVITVSNAKGTRTLDTPGEFVGLEEAPDATPRTAPQTMIERDFSAALAAEPDRPRRFLLYFNSGSVELTAGSAPMIEQLVAEINRRVAPEVAIVGHTDTAGSADANVALASQRAEAIRDRVLAAGIEARNVEVASYGERQPLIATADDVDEPRNRRVEVVVR